MKDFAYKSIVKNVKRAMLDAEKARACIKDDDRMIELSKACVFVLSGLACIRCAESVYACLADEFGELRILEDIIEKYDVFSKEVLQDYSENHSPQWVFIHFNELFDLVRSTVFDPSVGN